MSLKFSREDEQILALNYENLCDNDYLHKLFVSDQGVGRDEHSADQGKSTSDSHLSNAEFPEDVIIFGDQLVLGKALFDRRLRKDLMSYLKFQDGLGLQISRQAIIYEHMADVMLRRFADAAVSSSDKKQSSSSVALKSTASNDDQDMLRFVLESLFSIFGDDDILTASNLRSVLDVLVKFFDPIHSRHQDFSQRVSFDKIRFFASKSFQLLHSMKLLNRRSWDKASFREEVKSILYSIYCYVCIGLLSHDISDLVVALDCLIKLHIQVEARTEDVILQARETLPTVSNATNVTKVAAFPTMVPSSSKKLRKSGKDKVSAQGERVDATADAMEVSGEELKIDTTVDASTGDTPTLKSVGSGNKLNSLREKGPLPSGRSLNEAIPNREILKTKPSKKIQDSKAENDSKSDALVAGNHPVLEYDEPMINAPRKAKGGVGVGSSASGSLHTPPKVTSGSDGLSSAFSPRTTSRKLEREVKDCVHEAMRVPTTMIQFLSAFASAAGRIPAKSLAPKASTLVQDNSKGGTKVWSCGQNSYGELGLGDINTRKSFAKVSALDDKGIVSIGAGNEHSLFVTRTGKLFAAGYNDNGQCGVGTTQQVRQPTLVQSLEDEEIQHVFVFNGCEHTIVVTKEGKVFSFGYNYRGQVRLLNVHFSLLNRSCHMLTTVLCISWDWAIQIVNRFLVLCEP